ncbi:MAG: cysteine hydrolase family protein [Candidatus Helarchaeales archaeon]
MGSLIFHGNMVDNKGDVKKVEITWDPEETVLIIVDLWDLHWCSGANERLVDILGRANTTIKRARESGISIIHAPSETMDYYRNYRQRKRMMLERARVVPENFFELILQRFRHWRHFPIRVGSDGGCYCDPPCKIGRVWRSQHDAIEILDSDLISDRIDEIFGYLRNHRKKNIIYLGVHANMCIMNRPFGLYKMMRLGYNCLLIRDLTDVMYNPGTWPYVSHGRAKELVLRYIEQYLCPTITSDEI